VDLGLRSFQPTMNVRVAEADDGHGVLGKVESKPRSLRPGEAHGTQRARCGPQTTRPFGRDDSIRKRQIPRGPA
jgi:hypothetical protein